MKLFSYLCLLFAIFASSALASKGKPAVFRSVPREIVVKLSPAFANDANAFAKIAARLDSKMKSLAKTQVRKLMTSEQFAVLKISGDQKSAIQALQSDSSVAYAEPNYLYHAYSDPNDVKFSEQWGMCNTGQTDADRIAGKTGADIHIKPLWEAGITGSRNIKVAVIDTGIDATHPDLSGNVNTAEGFNFVNHTANAADDQGHGTHCAGVIGGLGNNTIGISGINWQVTLVPVKFLDANGSGSLASAVEAIQWATQRNVQVMSNSWGGGPYTQALYDAIAEARDHGIVFIAAAGNDARSNETTDTYPANYDLPNIVSVAATTNVDRLAGFSNYGATRVHVAAPGKSIVSTYPGNQYKIMSGTSMATPHVAGIAALLKSVNPSMTYDQIKSRLIRTSDKILGLSNKVVAKGRVNAQNAINNIEPVDPTPDESRWRAVRFGAETPHPYQSNHTYRYPFSVPGARYVRVIFSSLNTESGYDLVKVVAADGEVVDEVSGSMPAGYKSLYITGNSGVITFETDESFERDGFVVSRLEAIYE